MTSTLQQISLRKSLKNSKWNVQLTKLGRMLPTDTKSPLLTNREYENDDDSVQSR